MIGPIRQEILSGIRSESKFKRLQKHLKCFPDIPILTVDYVTAARVSNSTPLHRMMRWLSTNMEGKWRLTHNTDCNCRCSEVCRNEAEPDRWAGGSQVSGGIGPWGYGKKESRIRNRKLEMQKRDTKTLYAMAAVAIVAVVVGMLLSKTDRTNYAQNVCGDGQSYEAIVSDPVPESCTIFTASYGDTVLFGNNEDWINPNTYYWVVPSSGEDSVSYTHLTLPTTLPRCRSRWSPYH